jgi:hypothetical protein
MIMIFFDIDVHKRIDNNPCGDHGGLNYDDDDDDDDEYNGNDDEGVMEYTHCKKSRQTFRCPFEEYLP